MICTFLSSSLLLSSSPPCPTCYTSRAAPKGSASLANVRDTAAYLISPAIFFDAKKSIVHTAGKLTLGMMVSFNALGASLGLALVSPPGWYWYLPVEPLIQGSEPCALATLASEEDDVGLREKCHPTRPKAPVMIARRTCRHHALAVDSSGVVCVLREAYEQFGISSSTLLKCCGVRCPVRTLSGVDAGRSHRSCGAESAAADD